MQLFFCESLQNAQVVLNEEESRHCKVLRKQVGDELQLIDGKGHLALGRIDQIKSKSIELTVLNCQEKEAVRSYYFHLYIAPTKQNDRIEWMLEKAVEAGLDEITFIETEHSEKNRINIERLERIALSAIKQSAQFYLPKINPLQKLKTIKIDEHFLLAHCREDSEKKSLLEVLESRKGQKKISILIGPEGDFSADEIDYLYQHHLTGISLGNTRLRTETAGLYCAMVLNASL